MISVPGLGGKNFNAVLEDTRADFHVENLTTQLKDAVDSIDADIEALLVVAADSGLVVDFTVDEINKPTVYNYKQSDLDIVPSVDGKYASAAAAPM